MQRPIRSSTFSDDDARKSFSASVVQDPACTDATLCVGPGHVFGRSSSAATTRFANFDTSSFLYMDSVGRFLSLGGNFGQKGDEWVENVRFKVICSNTVSLNPFNTCLTGAPTNDPSTNHYSPYIRLRCDLVCLRAIGLAQFRSPSQCTTIATADCPALIATQLIATQLIATQHSAAAELAGRSAVEPHCCRHYDRWCCNQQFYNQQFCQ